MPLLQTLSHIRTDSIHEAMPIKKLMHGHMQRTHSHFNICKQIFCTYIIDRTLQIVGSERFPFSHIIESLVKVPPGLLLLGTNNLAEHIGWASQRVDEQDT